MTAKRFPSLLKDFLFKIAMRGNPLAVEQLSFQMLTFYCQSISFGLEMKSFLVQKNNNFEDERKKIVWYNLSNINIRNVHKPNYRKITFSTVGIRLGQLFPNIVLTLAINIRSPTLDQHLTDRRSRQSVTISAWDGENCANLLQRLSNEIKKERPQLVKKKVLLH